MIIHSCLIIKNEENNIVPLINQLLLFSDEIHITDTGSSDNTLVNIEELQKKHPNIFIHYYIWNNNFSDARNYSFYNYDNKSDFIFWCDADDLLSSNLIKSIQEFKSLNYKNTYDVYYLNYMYSKHFPKDLHYRTSILKTAKHFEWRDPIHEYINVDEMPCTLCFYFGQNTDNYIEHQRVHSATERNLNIFMSLYKNHYKFSSRNYYYFGQELLNNQLYLFAYVIFLECINKHDNQLDSTNASNSMYWISQNTQLPDYLPNIKDVLLDLYNRNWRRPDIVTNLAHIEYNNKNYDVAEKYYLEALDNLDNVAELFTFLYNKQQTHINILLQLSCIEYYYKKDYHKSLEYNKEILIIDPNHQTAINNIKIIEDNL